MAKVAALCTIASAIAARVGGADPSAARLAIMRGVEDGFAVARAAKQGLLTLSDSYGRIIALSASAKSGMVSLVGDLPRGPGNTVYLHIGDVFAWASSAGSILLLGMALRRARK